MARITRVKKAQQRYKTRPVLNADGTPKIVPVMARNGQQKVTKSGKLVTRRITAEDKAQPLPLHKCERCGKDIALGTPYQHVTPKSSAYGGRTRYRCGTCPGWQVWELSNSLSARIQQLQSENDVTVGADDTEEDVQGYLDNAAEAIRDLANEKRDSAANLEEGFGHATSQSEELEQTAEDLDGWADAVAEATIPDRPDDAGDEPDEPNHDDFLLDTEEADEEAYDAAVAAYDTEYSEWQARQEALEDWAGECTELIAEALGDSPC